MGSVYLAEDTQLSSRQVALKFLHQGELDHRARLQREAKALARLSHPNVVTVYELGMMEGRPFLAMEYIRATTLRSWLASARSDREILAAAPRRRQWSCSCTQGRPDSPRHQAEQYLGR